MKDHRKTELTLESDLRNVPAASSVIRSFCSETPLDETARYQIELSAVEAITNVIKHSYGSAPGHKISVKLSLYADCIRFQITDTGKAISEAFLEKLNGRDFSHRTEKIIEDPAVTEEAEEAFHETGRGLEIIDSCMDEIAYDSSGGANTLTITRFFTNQRTCGQASTV